MEMVKAIQNYPLYSIGVVSELLGVHPETIRTWERSGVVQPPQRRSGKRFYSQQDLNRLQFIQGLASEGLTLRAIRYYLRLYPCWKTADCPGCVNNSKQSGGAKHRWQEPGTYCQAVNSQAPCTNCHVVDSKEKQHETTQAMPEKVRHQ